MKETLPLSWANLLFSFTGRIDRRTYVSWIPLSIFVIGACEFYGLGELLSWVRGEPSDTTGLSAADGLIAASVALPLVLIIWIAAAGIVKRLHDRGWGAILPFAYFGSSLLLLTTSNWVVALLQALFGLTILVLVLGPSDEPNDYGEAPMRFPRRANAPTPPGWGGFCVDLLLMWWPLVAVLAARSFLLEPFDIPAGSMLPTLRVGDYIYVSKFAYGYSRYSIPVWQPAVTGRLLGKLPDRGDVAVFHLPRAPSIVYVKRVIGLPGDTVQVKHGQLYLNDTIVPRVQTSDYVDDEYGSPRPIRQFIETLPNGVMHPILQQGDDGPLDNTPIFNVPPDHVFLMGDNRSNSEDSRALSAVGYVSIDNLIGPAVFRYLSIHRAATGAGPTLLTSTFVKHDLWEFWSWPEEVLYNRVFTMIR